MAEWLFSSGAGAVSHDFAAREEARFGGGAGEAALAETPILPGIWLYRGEASGRSRFSIAVDGDPAARGRLILGAMLQSRGRVHMEGCGERHWRDEGRSYLLSPSARRVRYEIDAEQGWRLVAVRLEAEALDLLGADAPVPALVRQVLEGRRDDVADTAPLPGALRTLGAALLRPPYAGPMQRLFRQAKVLELLAHQLAALGEGADATALAPGERARVRAARDLLLADLGATPDLARLAQAAGLSPKRLNRGFRELYGTTVFEHLRDARLEAARAALAAGAPLPLKQLAFSLGYAQASNFVTAFRRRFGVTPGSYRGAGAGDVARRQ